MSPLSCGNIFQTRSQRAATPHPETDVLSQHDYSYNGVGQRKDALEKLGIYTPPAMDEAYAYDPLGNRQHAEKRPAARGRLPTTL